ncbi:MAG: hypothetical protein ACRDXX_08055, partial [Stackebrandtia sp.]
WQYWTPQGWSDDETEAAAAMSGVVDEFSVTYLNGQYLLLTQDSSTPFSDQIHAYTSCLPYGPFGDPKPVYQMPEIGPGGSYEDADVIAYNAHAHASLSDEGSLLLSYNVNSMDTGVAENADNYRDPSIYRPRFVRFDLAWP